MLRASTRLLLRDSTRAAPSAPAPLPARPPAAPRAPGQMERRNEARRSQNPPAQPPALPAAGNPLPSTAGVCPTPGDLVPLPRLPPAVSPRPGVPVTAPSEHGTGKGAGGVPVGPALPHTCQVTEPQPVTHGCSLPTPGTGVGTRHPHSPRPLTGLSAQGALTRPPPPGRGGQHPKEKGETRTPQRGSPGGDRRAPKERAQERSRHGAGGRGQHSRQGGTAASGVRGGPRHSSARLGGSCCGEKGGRRVNPTGKSRRVPRCYSPATHEAPLPQTTLRGRRVRGSGPATAAQSLGLGCQGKEAKRPQLLFRKVFGPLGASFSHSGSEQPPPCSP